LIVAGDAAYNGVHLRLVESNQQGKREEWIAALDKMESLKPSAVVAGHKRIGNEDSPRIIAESRKYIRDFARLAMTTTTAQELYDQMLKLYPGWLNRGGALEFSARDKDLIRADAGARSKSQWDETRLKPMKIAILDDYQNVALEMADWSALSKRADITVFSDHVSDPSALVQRLLPFDVVCAMRERTPLPREVLQSFRGSG